MTAPSATEPRTRLRTMTGEDFQPARAYYDVVDRRALEKSLHRLKCVRLDPKHGRSAWLWTDEARTCTFTVAYEQLPRKVHPIVLGDLRMRGDATLILEVKSFDRLIAGLQFFAARLPEESVRATHVRLANRLFSLEECPVAGQSLDVYLEGEGVVRTDPAAIANLLKNVAAGAGGPLARIRALFGVVKDLGQRPTPELEELPLNEDDLGDFASLRGGLIMRHMEAVEHWTGNTGVTQYDIMKRFLAWNALRPRS